MRGNITLGAAPALTVAEINRRIDGILQEVHTSIDKSKNDNQREYLRGQASILLLAQQKLSHLSNSTRGRE